MRKKLLVIIALGGTLAIVAAGSASSDSVGAGDLTATVPGTGGGNVLPQCADLSDNDGDGLVDLADPGCSSPADTDEYNAPTGGGTTTTGGGTTTSGGGTTTSGGGTTTTGGGRRQDRQDRDDGQGRQGRRERPLRQAEQEGQGRQGRRQGRAPEDHRAGPPQPRRLPNPHQPQPHGRAVRPRPDRRPQLPDRLLRDPALPAADLPVLRHRVRDPLAGARRDQQDRDRLRHQPERLLRRRRGLDAVHPLHLGRLRSRRQRGRAQGPLQPS